jgi:tetratricopeptide (TPR) repeat protein
MSDPTFSAAQHLLVLDRPEEALRKLHEHFDVTDPWHWWLRGLALLQLDRHDEALDATHEGLALDAEMIALLRLKARVHLDREELREAETAALAALRLDAEEPEVLALYALIVAKAQQLDKADKLIARARQIDPENDSAIRVEAALAMARGKRDVVLLRSRELLAIDPEDAHAHAMVGSILHDRGDVHNAAPHLRTAVITEPADSDYGEIARDNLYMRHWLMLPLRPVHRFGAGAIWLTGIALVFLTRRFFGDRIGLWFALVWIAYCVYSWVIPPLVRRRLR